MAMAYLLILKSSSFSKDLILRGKAGSAYADIPLKIVVCGDETIALADNSNTPVIVNELTTDLVASYDLSHSTIKDYFTVVTTSSSTFCGELTLGLFKDDSGTPWSGTKEVSLDGAVPD